jgi:hypothetical protein
MFGVNIIVKAIRNGWTDGELCSGEQLLYGMSKDMGGTVAIGLEKIALRMWLFYDTSPSCISL